MYPRQATLLKIIFLRDDLFTDYDRMVIQEWEDMFAASGDHGVSPGIMDRIRMNKENERKWFREVLLVMGRRAGKGHVSGLAMAYILWHYMAKGDPQAFYGISPSKKMECLIYAGKKEQARKNLYADLVNAITDGPCFAPYISRPLGEMFTVFAPADKLKMMERRKRNLDIGFDQATFVIQPKEATLMSGRGGASFMLGFDEMAHVVASGANRSAEEIYCLDPETRVLSADLTWGPLKGLSVGDKVVSFDEFPKAEGEQRKMREATVEGIRWSRSEPLKITFEDGTAVVCSENHRWFRVSQDGNNGKWIFAGRPPRQGSAGNPGSLKIGDHIRHIVDPWEVDESREGGYMAGILDGEGWMSSSLRSTYSAYRVGFSQNEGHVLDESVRILKQARFDLHTIETMPCKQIEVHGLADGLRMLGTYQPLRLMARSAEFWEGRTPRGKIKSKKIVSIEKLPEQDLVDIQTSEGTFLAEGLVSHNTAATPSLDQFKKDAFIVEPSSPWQQTGQFYVNWQQSIEINSLSGMPEYANMLMIQLASWEIYKDWQIAHEVSAFPPDFQGDLDEYLDNPLPKLPRITEAFQEYDDDMKKLEKSNPDTFKVERLSKWATTQDAYLDKEMIDRMFQDPEWSHLNNKKGKRGRLDRYYKAHADPSSSGANFGFAIAHTEPSTDGSGFDVCVFDYIHHWDPADYEDHNIDYIEVVDELWSELQGYPVDKFTVDQFSSGPVRSMLKHHQMSQPKNHKVIQFGEVTATAQLNWKKAENFKTALNQGWIKAPYYDLADRELRFLRQVTTQTTMRVEKQDTGPVTTKDVADCHDSKTEVLTERGWKLFAEVEFGEKVATRNSEGQLEYQHWTEKVDRYYEGPMVTYSGKQTNFCVTPGHRMLVSSRSRKAIKYDFKRADLLSRGAQYVIPKTTIVKSRNNNNVIDIDARTHIQDHDLTFGPWNHDEIQFLISEYPKADMVYLMSNLHRTRDSIYNKARELKLCRGQTGDRVKDRPGSLPPVDRELFAQFLGFWLAEGRKYHKDTHRGYGVKITQSKTKGIEWFDDLLLKMGWNAKRTSSPKEVVWQIHSYGLREYLKRLCLDEHELTIPDEVFTDWSKEEMEALLHGLSMGDGNFCEAKQEFTKYFSSSKKLADGVQRLLLHIGLTGTVRLSREAGTPISNFPEYTSNYDMWEVVYNRKGHSVIRGDKLEEEEYAGRVYCLTVPNGTLLTRRNNKVLWSGNCMFECVWALLGQQVEEMAAGLSRNPISGGLQGGITPFGNVSAADESVFRSLGGSGAARYAGESGFGGSIDPSRGASRRTPSGNRGRHGF
jgi:hypothetical protein